MKKIIDISWPITQDITTYKDRKNVHFEHSRIFDRDGTHESSICIYSHTGTHIDAPAHFVRDGKAVDQIALDALIGACRVLDFTHITEKITAQDLSVQDIQAGQKILFKTKNSLLGDISPFEKDFVYLDKSGAQFLADKKVSLIGHDYLGIERNQPEHETHKILLEHNVVIIEGLRLGHVVPGDYSLCCLPIAIKGLEAVMARAVLFINI
ncbi:MAG: cyclase family protein [bacterium]